MLAKTDLAYAAALIDNLAILRERYASGSYLPFIEISGKHPAMRWLAEVTGTRMVPTRRSYSRAPCSDHCDEKHQHIESESGRWNVSGTRAVIVLAAVAPYMRVQGAEARRLVEESAGLRQHADVVASMRELGWPIPKKEKSSV